MLNRLRQRIKTAVRLVRNARAMYEALREIKELAALGERFAISSVTLDEVGAALRGGLPSDFILR